MVIGEVTGPFGVRGEMKVSPLTDFPDRYKSLTYVFLSPSMDRYTVARSRVQASRILLKLDGIDTPEDVVALGHADISIPRSEAVALPDGAYYLEDMIGVQVRTVDNRDIGPITDILRTGSNDVWIVRNGKQSVLIPAIADAVQSLNVEENYAVIFPWVLQQDE